MQLNSKNEKEESATQLHKNPGGAGGAEEIIKNHGPLTQSEYLERVRTLKRDGTSDATPLIRAYKRGRILRVVTIERGRPVWLYYIPGQEEKLWRINKEVYVPLRELDEYKKERIRKALSKFKCEKRDWITVEMVANEIGMHPSEIEREVYAVAKEEGMPVLTEEQASEYRKKKLEHSRKLIPGFVAISKGYGGKLDYIIKEFDLKIDSKSCENYKRYAFSHLESYKEKELVNKAKGLFKKVKREGARNTLNRIREKLRERFDNEKIPDSVIHHPVRICYDTIRYRLKGVTYDVIYSYSVEPHDKYDFLGGLSISKKGYGEDVQRALQELCEDPELKKMVSEDIKNERNYENFVKKADEALLDIVRKILLEEKPLEGKCDACPEIL